MSQQNDSGIKGFECSAAIAQYARVVMAADGTVSTAGATEKGIGIARVATFASGEVVGVELYTKSGTLKMIAGAAVAAGATVNTIASGKVDDNGAAGSFDLGIALEAATADGDIIEVLPSPPGTANS